MSPHSDQGLHDALDRVRDLRPLIASHGEANERERQLARPVVDALNAAGLLQVMVPRSLGGLELSPASAYRVIEEVARIDGATGWCVGIAQAWASVAAGLPDAGIAEIFASPSTVLAGAFLPTAGLSRVPGGFRLSNRAPFASGCTHATAMVMTGVEMQDEQPVLNAVTGSPDLHLLFVPAHEVAIHDTWDTLGMRGTGSHDIEVTDVFVPDHRVTTVGVRSSSAHMNPMYSIFLVGPQAEAAASVGVAQGAIDSLVELAGTKVPALSAASLRDRPTAQHQVAEAQALVDAARASLAVSAAEAVDEVATTGGLAMATRLKLQLAANFAADGCARAVQLVWAAAGTSGIRPTSPLHRQFRDIHTLSQHASKSLPRYESVGRVMFGLEADYAILSL